MCDILRQLKINLRESEEAPYFTDEELMYYYKQFNKDIRLTTYKLLIIKSENNAIRFNGSNMEDDSKYWLRMASMYKPNGSRVL